MHITRQYLHKLIRFVQKLQGSLASDDRLPSDGRCQLYLTDVA